MINKKAGGDLANDMMKIMQQKINPQTKDISNAIELISDAASIFNECGLEKEAKALKALLKNIKG